MTEIADHPLVKAYLDDLARRRRAPTGAPARARAADLRASQRGARAGSDPAPHCITSGHGIDPLITLGGLLVLVALPVVTSIYRARRMRSLRCA